MTYLRKALPVLIAVGLSLSSIGCLVGESKTKITYIKKDEKGIYQMFLHHNFRVTEFSDYWGEYFKKLLEDQKKVSVEIFSRKELLTLRIAPK